MHTHDLSDWQHRHDFGVTGGRGERLARAVFLVTAATMAAELAAGTLFGSMALLADGWHMGTHVAAFLITLFAYAYARRHRDNPDFTFGVGKVGVLGGFASAVALAVVALAVAAESLGRLLRPEPIRFNEAIAVAVFGLLVNVLCALLLHPHEQEGDPHGEHHGHRHDHNLRAAYLHVLADALTSVLAIAALLLGKGFGWLWLDPLMGLAGGAVITRWAFGLLRETAPILLDSASDADARAAVLRRIEAVADTQVADLHLWKVGPDDFAAVVSLVTHTPQPVERYKALLSDVPGLSHVTVEVLVCEGAASGAQNLAASSNRK